jgi:hypothetical protein
MKARGPADVDRVFSDMTRARAGALTLLGNALFFNERRRLVDREFVDHVADEAREAPSRQRLAGRPPGR